MQPAKNKIFEIIKWLIMIIAYAYLVYKLSDIEYWKELKSSFTNVNLTRILYFLAFLLLMPVNWALEVIVWRLLCAKTVRLSFMEATKSILAGLNTGFITPSRFGEFAGRIIFMPEDKRLNGILLTFVNSFIQTFAITVFGLIAAYFYTAQFHFNIDFSKYLISIGITLLVLAGIYFLIPGISEKFKTHRWAAKVKNMVQSLKELSPKTVTFVFLICTLRFFIFCFQYYLLLFFFKIELTSVEALVGIPTMYLLVTYAPTLAASEAAVRGSFAVLILGVYSHNEIGILLTGIIIWLINFILPMILGSYFILQKNGTKAKDAVSLIKEP